LIALEVENAAMKCAKNDIIKAMHNSYIFLVIIVEVDDTKVYAG
jgi:hypothetical protein